MEKELEEQRRDRVESLERMGYIKNSAIKKAMLKVKREDFVLPKYKQQAYIDTPLPIPGGVTISAPHN